VHRTLTTLLARAAGFSDSLAAQIGAATQHVDDDPATNPMNITFTGVVSGRLYDVEATYHFTTDETRAGHWQRFVSSKDIGRLGIYLHADEDSYSHAGYGPRLGHLSAGHAPDKTATDPGKANQMAYDAYDALIAAKQILGGKVKSLDFDAIRPYVDKFNRARTDREKEEAIEAFSDFLDTFK
jgi:hypothetical protein